MEENKDKNPEPTEAKPVKRKKSQLDVQTLFQGAVVASLAVILGVFGVNRFNESQKSEELHQKNIQKRDSVAVVVGPEVLRISDMMDSVLMAEEKQSLLQGKKPSLFEARINQKILFQEEAAKFHAKYPTVDLELTACKDKSGFSTHKEWRGNSLRRVTTDDEYINGVTAKMQFGRDKWEVVSDMNRENQEITSEQKQELQNQNPKL